MGKKRAESVEGKRKDKRIMVVRVRVDKVILNLICATGGKKDGGKRRASSTLC